MTQGPELTSTKRLRQPCSSTCAPSWRISWRWWWKPEKLNVFSPGHFCTRFWNLPKETVGTHQKNCKTWLDILLELFFTALVSGKGFRGKTILIINQLKKFHLLCTFKLQWVLHLLPCSAASLGTHAPTSVGMNSVWIKHFLIWEPLPRWCSGKESACQCRRHGFSWVRRWQLTPVFLPGEFHGQRSLAGYSPWGWHKWDCMHASEIHKISLIKKKKKKKEYSWFTTLGYFLLCSKVSHMYM